MTHDDLIGLCSGLLFEHASPVEVAIDGAYVCMTALTAALYLSFLIRDDRDGHAEDGRRLDGTGKLATKKGGGDVMVAMKSRVQWTTSNDKLQLRTHVTPGKMLNQPSRNEPCLIS